MRCGSGPGFGRGGRPHLRRSFAGACLLLSFAVVGGCSRSPGSNGQGAAGGDSDAAVEAAVDVPSGWAGRFAGTDGTRVGTLTPTAAFALDQGQSVHPAIAPAGFEAVFEGVVTIRTAGKYRFGGEVEGGVANVGVKPLGNHVYGGELAAGGQPGFGEWLSLRPGPVRVTYAFTRDGDAEARFRPLWQMERSGLEGFDNEPIPSRVVRVSTTDRADAEGWLAAERGRVLLGDLGCVQCHGGTGSVAAGRVAPDLTHVGQRADAGWLARWVQSPQQVKPGSGMPGLIADDVEQGAALVAYLRSLSEPVEWPAAATETQAIDSGRVLYESAGCIACHGVASGEQPDGWAPRYPFGDLAGKWNPASLSVYLQPPSAGGGAHHRASMNLPAQEADLIATYLISVWGEGAGEPLSPDGALIARGGEVFAAVGCANCHDLEGVEPGLTAKPLGQLDPTAGCLDEADTATPRYSLTDAQRADLRAAVSELSGWTADADAPTDHAHITMQTLNCVACHNWHDRGGVPEPVRDFFAAVEDADLGDEGRFPPRLDGVGWKLTNTWLGQVIGEGARARPYMLARMPAVDSPHARAAVDGLARLDGVWPGADAREPEVTDTMVQHGLKLVGTGGFNCISCHTFGDRPPAGLPGPNIAQFGERIRYDWWQRYVFNPQRFKDQTRMPSFFASGSSALTSIAGGDAHAQVDAMWAYFSLGELFMPAPEGVIVPGGMEVVVTDEPAVLRTFLKDVGARGIAVGFPAGLHFAFDANTSRLRYAWTGSFLDASGAWAGRGGTVVGGQGPTVWTGPDGPVVAIGQRPADWAEALLPSFGGYRLDDDGVPTFLSHIGGVGVTETIRPYPRAGALFSRTITFSNLDADTTVWVRGGERSGVASVSGGSAEPVDGVWRIRAEDSPVVLVLEVLP